MNNIINHKNKKNKTSSTGKKDFDDSWSSEFESEMSLHLVK